MLNYTNVSFQVLKWLTNIFKLPLSSWKAASLFTATMYSSVNKTLVFSNSYMDLLSKSINGFRKSTETSVKIIFENIKNRNRDCWKKASISTHLWTQTLKIVTHGSLFGLKVSLTCMDAKCYIIFTQIILVVANVE